MYALVMLVVLTISACTAHTEPAIWKLTVTADGEFGPLRQAHPEAVREAVSTYEQFLTELDARYFEEVPPDLITLYAMQGALARLNAHGEVIRLNTPSPCQSEIGIGATLTRDYRNDIRISHLAPTSPMLDAGVRAGARILGVEGTSTNTLTSSDTAEKIICNGKSSVTLAIEQDGISRVVQIEKRKNTFLPTRSAILRDGIHYLWISSLSEFSIASQAIAQLERARATPASGVILDLRSMSGGYVAAGKILLTMLVPAGSIALRYNDSPVTVPALRTPLANPLIVLVNTRTASLGEVLALALQDYGRAVIIGEQTAGFGTALGEVILSDESTAYIPHVIYRGPNGTEIEGKGVMPDILVHDTSPYGYYQEGMPDNIMATALAYLHGERLQYAKAP